MKMEVLTRGHHHQQQKPFQQTQFEVIGSNKIQDWATPLTPPPSAVIPSPHHHRFHPHHHHHHHHHSNGHHLKSHRTGDTTPTSGPPPIVLDPNNTTTQALAMRLQAELRAAKSRHLACTEVLLPAELLHHVAGEMVSMSEKEPCGIRGCSVFIEFEDEPGNSRRIATLQVDANTVSTFELYLTLKHARSGWTSILPQFLKNLARSSTIVISPDYMLTKNKLYNSFLE